MITATKPSDKAIIAEYTSGDNNVRAALEKLYGKKMFAIKATEPKDIMSQVNSFADILKITKTSQAAFDKKFKHLAPDTYTYEQMKLFTSVLNQGWVPDYGNSSEYKWFPYFKFNSSTSGFGFTDSGYDCDYAHSCTAARLVFKNV